MVRAGCHGRWRGGVIGIDRLQFQLELSAGSGKKLTSPVDSYYGNYRKRLIPGRILVLGIIVGLPPATMHHVKREWKNYLACSMVRGSRGGQPGGHTIYLILSPTLPPTAMAVPPPTSTDDCHFWSPQKMQPQPKVSLFYTPTQPGFVGAPHFVLSTRGLHTTGNFSFHSLAACLSPSPAPSRCIIVLLATRGSWVGRVSRLARWLVWSVE